MPLGYALGDTCSFGVMAPLSFCQQRGGKGCGGEMGGCKVPPLPPPFLSLPCRKHGEKPACENQSFLRFWVPVRGQTGDCAIVRVRNLPNLHGRRRVPWVPHGSRILPRIASRFTGPLSPMGQHDPAQPRLNRASRAPSGVLGGEACKAPPPHPSGVAMLGSSSTSTQLPGNPPSGPSPQKRKQNQQQHGGLLCSPPFSALFGTPRGGCLPCAPGRLGG